MEKGGLSERLEAEVGTAAGEVGTAAGEVGTAAGEVGTAAGESKDDSESDDSESDDSESDDSESDDSESDDSKRVFFGDEMRLGLIGQVRRRWVPRGVKIRQPVEFEYEWSYLNLFELGGRPAGRNAPVGLDFGHEG